MSISWCSRFIITAILDRITNFPTKTRNTSETVRVELVGAKQMGFAIDHSKYDEKYTHLKKNENNYWFTQWPH